METTTAGAFIAYPTNRVAGTITDAEEIAEALGVAIAVNAGAALVLSARAMDAFAALEGQEQQV